MRLVYAMCGLALLMFVPLALHLPLLSGLSWPTTTVQNMPAPGQQPQHWRVVGQKVPKKLKPGAPGVQSRPKLIESRPKVQSIELSPWPFDPSLYDPEDIILVSYMTDVPPKGSRNRRDVLTFVLSAKRMGFKRIILVGAGMPKRSKMEAATFEHQVRYTLKTMLKLHRRQVVIFADLFDIIWLGPMSEHLRRYKQYFVEDGAATGGYVPGEEGRRWPVVVQGDRAPFCRAEPYDYYWNETVTDQCSGRHGDLYRCPFGSRTTPRDLYDHAGLSPFPNTGHYIARVGDLLPALYEMLASYSVGIDQGWTCRNIPAQRKLPLRQAYDSYPFFFNSSGVEEEDRGARYPRLPVVVDGHGVLSLNANTAWQRNWSRSVVPLAAVHPQSPMAEYFSKIFTACDNSGGNCTLETSMLVPNATGTGEAEPAQVAGSDGVEPRGTRRRSELSIVGHLPPLSIHFSGTAKPLMRFLSHSAYVNSLFDSRPWEEVSVLWSRDRPLPGVWRVTFRSDGRIVIASLPGKKKVDPSATP